MKTFFLMAMVTIAALSSSTRLAAQCRPQFNISVYSDGDASTDGSMIYGYSSTDDSSTLCTCVHYNYQTAAYVELANGSYASNTESGETSSVSSPTDGDGSYYAFGAAGLICSCAGNIGGGGGTSVIDPPAPVITGIADTVTWDNTIYQGASGYLAIFGTALTAWGETPTPSVTGDSGVTINSVSYASDGQVNVTYTVAANAAITSHNILLQTGAGRAQGGAGVASAPDHVSVLVDQQGPPRACPTGLWVREMQMQIVNSSNQAITNNPSIAESFSNQGTNTCGNGLPTPTSCGATGTQGNQVAGTFIDFMAVSNNFCNSGIVVGSGCGYTLTSNWSMCSNGLANSLWTSPRNTLSNGITVNSNSSMFPVGTQLH